MNVKPKYIPYNIRRMCKVSLIEYVHENDVDTQVLEVSMLDNGEPIELDADYTYSAAIVNRDTKALINDNISCELNDSGNVLIPIDNFHTLGAQDLLIELTITDSTGDQVLVTPFPLWIHVNASILDDAQVTPESEGTVPELLEEAKEALENAGDYESLENKPQINGHELVGNKSSDDLGLQGKLTAGENITINANGEISATGGTDDYEELTNKPQINGHELSGDQSGSDLGLQNQLTAGDNVTIENGVISASGGVPVTVSSAAVNQNGTITFTMSDGSTVTTTGQSVIGESAYQVAVDNGFIGTEQEWLASLKGEQGDAYVLTAQDKSDIAAIVLSELPTTQGVQYGNTSN